MLERERESACVRVCNSICTRQNERERGEREKRRKRKRERERELKRWNKN